jgi:hypothetical protein
MDCDPKYFRVNAQIFELKNSKVVLNWLRHGEVMIDPSIEKKGVTVLAKYFQLMELAAYLESCVFVCFIFYHLAEKWQLVLEETFFDSKLDSEKWNINNLLLDAAVYTQVYGKLGLLNRV